VGLAMQPKIAASEQGRGRTSGYRSPRRVESMSICMDAWPNRMYLQALVSTTRMFAAVSGARSVLTSAPLFRVKTLYTIGMIIPSYCMTYN
jgi:hypothetical protein